MKTLLRISLAGLAFASLVNSASAQGTKADNTTALNLSGSWVGGTFPNSGTLMIVDSTLTTARTAALGGNLSVLGITASSANTLQVNNTGGATLTIGTSGINSSGAGALTFNNATSLGGNITLANTATGILSLSHLTLTTNQTWALGSTSTNNRITLTGTLTTGGNTLNVSANNGNFGILNFASTGITLGSEVTIGTMANVYVQGGANITFNGTNNTNSGFAMFGNNAVANIASMGNLTGASSIGKGNATVNGGSTLTYTGNNALSDKGFIRINAGATANSNSTIQVQTSGQTLSMSGNLTSTGVSGGWILGGAGNLTLSGVINNATSTTVTKQDAGTLTLSGAAANTYAGATTVSAGTMIVSGGGLTATSGITVSGGALELGASDVLNNAATMTLSGGTFKTVGFNESLGALTLTNALTSTLDFGSGTSVLLFDSITNNTGHLNIINWTTGSGESLRFTSNANLSASSFTVNGGAATILDNHLVTGYYEVVPEPATWALLAFSLTTVMVLRRRRKS